MPQQIFKSQYPILEACMNRGSTLPLALAVHMAGGYPSLCSWTYGKDLSKMQADLNKFVAITKSNKIQLSFDITPWSDPTVCHKIVKSHNVPTIEIIYSGTILSESKTVHITDEQIIAFIKPLHDMGVKIFKRIYEPHTQESMDKHFIDGFCIKGEESAGLNSLGSVKDNFIKQKELTPSAYLIPYGGVGTAQQVKEYIDLGCEMVGVGTLLALSKESSIKQQTKLAAVVAKKEDMVHFERKYITEDSKILVRRQTALQFGPRLESDDHNGTQGLIAGVWEKDTDKGHVYLGHAVDNVTEILTCKKIIQNLVADLI